MSWILPVAASLSLAAPPAQEVVPPAPIAGLSGFQTTSHMVFAGQDDAPHVLQAVYVFPDRVRLHRSLVGAGPSERDVEYRSGSQVFRLPQGQPRSEAKAGEAQVRALLHMEVRRAAMLWPDGFDWSKEKKKVRKAPVLDRAGGSEIGSIEARLDRRGRPEAFVATDAEGFQYDFVRIESWFEAEKRKWPRELSFEFEGKPVWTETIESVTTKVRYLDLFFQPPDRRPRSVTPQGPTIVSLDIVPVTLRALELEPGTDWTRARAEFEGELRRLEQRLGEGYSLDPTGTFEVDEDGHPIRALLRLERPLPSPPEGWSNLAERQGLALVGIESPAGIDRRALELLRRRVPPGAEAGTPYVRLHEVGESLRVHVLLPFEAAR